jgi:hypothetical protein
MLTLRPFDLRTLSSSLQRSGPGNAGHPSNSPGRNSFSAGALLFYAPNTLHRKASLQPASQTARTAFVIVVSALRR